MNIHPYLHFNGNCEAAFNLYERIFGGKITCKMTHGESPMADRVGPDWQGKIMHASIAIGDQVINGMDAPGAHYSAPAGFSLTVNTSDPAEAETIFNALSQDGKVIMPLEKTFWAERFGMLTDPFGIPWMVNCAAPMQP